ncbi:MAG: transcription initiation factor IIB, partial [Candidatus Heimdallarchaeaceae archaeon]
MVSRLIDSSPEWRAFSGEERANKSRTGSPISALKSDYGVSSQISYGNIDIFGKKLDPNVVAKMRRLRWLNKRDSRSQIRNLSYGNIDIFGKKLDPNVVAKMRRLRWLNKRDSRSQIRNLRIALRELKRIASQLEISEEIAEAAAKTYRKALKADLIRGRSIESMVAAAIYLAARQYNNPTTLKDIEKHIRADRKVIARCFRLYVQELNIRPTPIDPTLLLSKLCDELELTSATQTEARIILEETKSRRLDMGKNPLSVAAAAIYIAGIRTGERRTQQQVAKVAKTTPVTLRNRFREIVDALEFSDVIVKRG